MKIKINNLINKRQLAIQLFSIVASGVVGLTFLAFTVKTVVLIIAGVYFAFILLNNYVELDKLINSHIKTMEEPE